VFKKVCLMVFALSANPALAMSLFELKEGQLYECNDDNQKIEIEVMEEFGDGNVVLIKMLSKNKVIEATTNVHAANNVSVSENSGSSFQNPEFDYVAQLRVVDQSESGLKETAPQRGFFLYLKEADFKRITCERVN
jgi:hypothetical protein